MCLCPKVRKFLRTTYGKRNCSIKIFVIIKGHSKISKYSLLQVMYFKISIFTISKSFTDETEKGFLSYMNGMYKRDIEKKDYIYRKFTW